VVSLVSCKVIIAGIVRELVISLGKLGRAVLREPTF
jgi:hypothetical protein